MEAEKVRQIILSSTALSPKQAEKILNAKDENGKTLLEVLSKGRGKNQAITPEWALERLCGHLQLPFLKDIPSEDIPPGAGFRHPYPLCENPRNSSFQRKRGRFRGADRKSPGF